MAGIAEADEHRDEPAIDKHQVPSRSSLAVRTSIDRKLICGRIYQQTAAIVAGCNCTGDAKAEPVIAAQN